MLAADFPEFEATIKRLEWVFRHEASDELMQVYWQALKDQPLAQFRRLADFHIRNGKFFPKPFELRPKEERGTVRSTKADAEFAEGEARAIRNLEELRARDPAAHFAEVRKRKLDRIMATMRPDEPGYRQAMNEWSEARGTHVGKSERISAASESR